MQLLHKISSITNSFWTREGSQIAKTVVVGVVVTLFEKCLRLNTHRTVRKLRIHIRDHIPDRCTVSDF